MPGTTPSTPEPRHSTGQPASRSTTPGPPAPHEPTRQARPARAQEAEAPTRRARAAAHRTAAGATLSARLTRAAMLLAALAVVLLAAWWLRSPSQDLVVRIAPTTAELPGIAAVSEIAVVLLGVCSAIAGLQALRRGGDALRLAVAIGVGVVAAYGASEVIKSVVRADRVCRDIAAVDCPSLGSWGFPSNHTTIAVAGATAIVLLVGTTWPSWARWGVVALAVLAGLGRVLQGVHAPHEVVAGAALGSVVVVVVVLVLAPVLGVREPLRAR